MSRDLLRRLAYAVAVLIVDLIVVAALVSAFVVGIARGFVASAGTIAGLVLGAVAAGWAVPILGGWIPDAQWRGVASAAAAVGLVIAGAAIGSAVGAAVRRGVERTPLKAVDRILGAIVGPVATALVLLTVGQALAATGTPIVSSAVASSRVLAFIDELTPDPVDAALAQVRGIVVDEGIPKLGELLQTTTRPTVPPVALDDPDLEVAAASVARISGTAYACGVSTTGSGFVAATGLIITNAHVVAGVDSPLIELPGGTAREGRVVYFDAIDDLAVIAVDELDAAALALTDDLEPGDTAVIQGYPLGGPFTTTGAAVLSVGQVPVPDIYDRSASPREIYSLSADVQPGNSGGPLLTDDGEVAGVVFARGADDESRGYAMTAAEVAPVLTGVTAGSRAVSTGDCTG